MLYKYKMAHFCSAASDNYGGESELVRSDAAFGGLDAARRGGSRRSSSSTRKSNRTVDFEMSEKFPG